MSAPIFPPEVPQVGQKIRITSLDNENYWVTETIVLTRSRLREKHYYTVGVQNIPNEFAPWPSLGYNSTEKKWTYYSRWGDVLVNLKILAD